MSDKKNEDFAIRMPDSDSRDDYEKDPFLGSRASPAASTLRNRNLNLTLSKLSNNPGLSIISYCVSSISMTVVNKYVVSGSQWNLYFFYLAIQVRLA